MQGWILLTGLFAELVFFGGSFIGALAVFIDKKSNLSNHMRQIYLSLLILLFMRIMLSIALIQFVMTGPRF